MLTFKLNGEFIQPPSVGIAWKSDNQVQKKEIQLPITISKFLNPVELSYEKFNTFYNDYSLANEKFFKIDSFLKMPSDRENSDYLKKVGAFLKSVCNFHCNAKPSFENIQLIYASSSAVLRNGDKPINIPILIEVQIHEK